MTDPHLKTWFQMYNEERQKNITLGSRLNEAKKQHIEIGELLKYFELNQRFPDNRKLDYDTLLYAWVKFNGLEDIEE